MALEQLIATLEREARSEQEAMLAAARSGIAASRAAANEQMEQRRTQATADRERRIEAALRAGLNEERRASRGLVLEARRRLVDRTFASARALLVPALETPEYRERLPGLVSQALEFLGNNPATIRAHPSITARLGEVLKSRSNISIESDSDVGAGFKLMAEGNALEIDCTLEARLEAARPALTIEVVGKLERDK